MEKNKYLDLSGLVAGVSSRGCDSVAVVRVVQNPSGKQKTSKDIFMNQQNKMYEVFLEWFFGVGKNRFIIPKLSIIGVSFTSIQLRDILIGDKALLLQHWGYNTKNRPTRLSKKSSRQKISFLRFAA